MRTRSVFPRDTELSVRMFFVIFMLAVLYLAFIAAFFYAGADYSTILIVAVVLLGIQYFFSDRLVLATMGAQIVSPEQAPELHDIVDRLSQMANLPKPKVAIVNSPMPNAFATGRDPNHSVVAVTTGLLNRLERDEIMSVLGHELTHVKNRDAMVMTLASFFATVAMFVMRIGMFGGFGYGRRGRDRNGAGGIAIIYLASIVVWLISYILIRALSRYREYAADRGSAIITGAPMTLATALQKISGDMARIPDRDLREAQGMNAFFIIPAINGQSFMELFSTHPSLQHRLDRLYRLQQQMEGLGPR